jgi:hypothetical protein
MKLNFSLWWLVAAGLVVLWIARQPKAPVKRDISLDDDVLLGGQGAMFPLDEPNLAGDRGEYAFAG